MIPGAFEYHRPGSIDDAVALLARFGDEGKVLAGGHSLVPMMKLRLAEPAHLVDIGAIGDLKGIRQDGDEIVIGATTTQAEVMESALLHEKCPIVPAAAALIADPQVRARGTMGGNVANGDPGNDHPAVMMALGARYVLRGADGERSVAAVDFYEGIYATALAEAELLTEIRVPVPAAGSGWSYRKLKRKVGDFATAAAAVLLRWEGGACAGAAVALTNVADQPFLCSAAAAALVGGPVDDAAIDEAASRVMAECAPADDLRGSPEFRTRMAGEMTRRALRDARDRAQGR